MEPLGTAHEKGDFLQRGAMMRQSIRFLLALTLVAGVTIPTVLGQDRDRDRRRNDRIDIRIDGKDISRIVADALREARRSIDLADLDHAISDAIRDADVDRTVRRAMRDARRSIRRAHKDADVDVYLGDLDLSDVIQDSLRATETVLDSIPLEEIIQDSLRSIDLEALRGVEEVL